MITNVQLFNILSTKYHDASRQRILRFCVENPKSEVAQAVSINPSILDDLDGFECRAKLIVESLEKSQRDLEAAVREYRLGETDC
jgi:hypothetical protein